MIYLSSLNDDTQTVSSSPISNAPSTSTALCQVATAGCCVSCLIPITDQHFLLMNEQSWHYECLRCCLCHCSLHNASTCYYKNGMVLCRDDYLAKYGKRCERCAIILCDEDIVMRANDAIFHLECFTCYVCSIPLQPSELFIMGCNGTLYCNAHFGAINPTNDDNSLRTTASSEISLIGGKERCRKWRKSTDDIESTTDSIDCVEEEALSITHKSKRMRTSFKHHQLRTMKSYFNLNHNPDAKDLKQLAQRTGLTKRVLQVWFQNARAKFRRNSIQCRETSSNSPHVPSLPSTTFNEPIEPITCGSVGDSMEESWQTSVSPEEGSQRDEHSGSSNDDNELNNGKTETEKSGCISSSEKSLAEYFETDQTML
ncbi:homeobox domain containing protein [Brugia malayi]|uniref:Homeobox domain containing protein n=1 Tax=Brugia malayi TaxID=6279 RepID=A0A4E9EVS9_BRUMA|nr:homeobox domain containing protein [Brugia malayi]VIO88338.1 homeobox domain containing protein [Brugia malayi]